MASISNIPTALGLIEDRGTVRTKVFPFEQYEVIGEVNHLEQLVRVIAIRIKKDFLSLDQIRAKSRNFNVDRFYQDQD